MKTPNSKSFHGLACIITICFVQMSLIQVPTGSIKGKVVSKEMGQAIVGSTLKLTDSRQKVFKIIKSTNLGEFEFENIPVGSYHLTVSKKGFKTYFKKDIQVKVDEPVNLMIKLGKAIETIAPELTVTDDLAEKEEVNTLSNDNKFDRGLGALGSGANYRKSYSGEFKSSYAYNDRQSESYQIIDENNYKLTTVSPLSTFSIDVDAASYSNMRRFIMMGQKAPIDAIRIEEMINYFSYDYQSPKNDQPFSITTEVGDCPWSQNKLVHIGLQGESIQKDNLPSSNLVFLLDVSGSMNNPDKLPLLKKSFKMLVNELNEKDRIAIVVYAGAAGMVLESTPASEKDKILEALDKLSAGGSTAGGAGIKLAYDIASENFIEGGNNRVILATDGDFNVGMNSDNDMQRLIEKKRESGVFLTCLGFGRGNLKDSKMELLADKGNGNYAYIDNLFEAKKVLVTEMGGTLVTIAKDVKIQVEFNPEIVDSYRLVGYENRLLNAEDFNDDTKDAGEIGSGHSVTALYEVVLKGEGQNTPSVDPLRYQNSTTKSDQNEMLTVKFRYKAPTGDVSQLIERHLKYEPEKTSDLSNNYMFSAAVAEFGMLLRNSDHKGDATFDHVLMLAQSSKGEDLNGYRAEFIRLVDLAKSIY